MALLEINNLNLDIRGKPILKNVSFSLQRGKITGLVGESGSGKSLTALAIMQLLPGGTTTTGILKFDDRSIPDADEATMCDLRGDDIGMVFQEPMTALNPLMTIGDQVAEGIRIHAKVDNKEAEVRASAILERVGLPHDRFPLSRYPHELSGGQRQRVVIAMACALKPKLLIADEPTTALDVIVQARILDLLKELVDENDMALLLISHDLGVVAGIADDIVVMRDGTVMEQGVAIRVLKERKHPYTAQLAEASSHVPARAADWREQAGTVSLVSVKDIVCEYPGNRISLFKKPLPFRAVDKVSFTIGKGEILGLVGESGCGKSTLSRALLGLMRPAAGSVEFEGRNVANSENVDRSETVKFVQAVFQDPYGSFNPRQKAERLVTEPLFMRQWQSSGEKRDWAVKALEDVGLTASDLDKYPHEFSGGQRQRLAIARAIVNRPKLIVADEPVSALDVSIRAQVLDLIIELRERLDLAWLFVSHDLAVVRALCENVMVMQDGIILEQGPVENVYNSPQVEYTRQLVAAAPDLARAIASRG
jgi:peptide/nickel transport system ATP-binding protein